MNSENVIFERGDLKIIPEIYADTIVSSFGVYGNKLVTLENSPKIVNGVFVCSNNKLLSLFGAPKIQGNRDLEYFWCDINFLMSLDFLPLIVIDKTVKTTWHISI